MNIEFDDNLITGNQTIDDQHRELIQRISAFVQACEMGESKVKAIQMLDYLDEYTRFHFNAEEELQKNVGYPELKKHQEKHQELIQTIKDLYEYLDEYEGPNDRFVNLVQEKVVNWLFSHIKTFDRSVAEFIFLSDNPDRI